VFRAGIVHRRYKVRISTDWHGELGIRTGYYVLLRFYTDLYGSERTGHEVTRSTIRATLGFITAALFKTLLSDRVPTTAIATIIHI
jgi:hypothetical protein